MVTLVSETIYLNWIVNMLISLVTRNSNLVFLNLKTVLLIEREEEQFVFFLPDRVRIIAPLAKNPTLLRTLKQYVESTQKGIL